MSSNKKVLVDEGILSILQHAAVMASSINDKIENDEFNEKNNLEDYQHFIDTNYLVKPSKVQLHFLSINDSSINSIEKLPVNMPWIPSLMMNEKMNITEPINSNSNKDPSKSRIKTSINQIIDNRYRQVTDINDDEDNYTLHNFVQNILKDENLDDYCEYKYSKNLTRNEICINNLYTFSKYKLL